LLALAPASANATTTFGLIASAGPLTGIYLGNDLDCQITHAGDVDFNGDPQGEFFPPDSISSSGSTPGDCGTFVSLAVAGAGNELFGPNFSTNNASATPFVDGDGYTPLAVGTQSLVSGSGTAANPFSVTTTATAGGSGLSVSQTDSYVTGHEYYRTDITLTAGRIAVSGKLYHAGDCYLQGTDAGFGEVSAAGAPACAANANNSPPGLLEEFAPLTAGSHFVEGDFTAVWGDLASQIDLPGTCDCAGDPNSPGQPEDNGAGVNWDFSLPVRGTATFSLITNFSATGVLSGAPESATPPTIAGTATQGQVLTETNGTWANSPTAFEHQWEDCDTSGANCVAIGGATGQTYALQASDVGHTVRVAETAFNASGPGNPAVSAPTAPVAAPPTSAPSVLPGATTVKGTGTAAFAGAVDPNGSATTAHFEYGLDPKYNGGGPVVYDQSTPSMSVGSDFSDHPVSATATGLVPNAEYHVRLVATNSQGTVVGPDATFTTRQDPAPPPPVLGQTENLMPVTGLVFIKLPHGKSPGNALSADAKALTKGLGYIPLTEARQVPVGTSIDSRRGTLSLVAASGHGHGHSEQTHTARVGGAVFGFAQSKSPLTKGLTTFTLKDNAFHGAPNFNACKANASLLKRLPTADAIALKKRVNSTVVQTLNASDHGGKYKTNGRYSASTVRGTVYSVSDRCDGTLTTVKRGSISVLDFQTRKTIIVHAGHSYLARAIKANLHTHKKKHHKNNKKKHHKG
jgi:hypothetical protein